MAPKTVWLDGEFLSYAQAGIPPLSHSIAYASTIYEGMRSYSGHIFMLSDHLVRLRKSAAIFMHSVLYSDDQLAEICYELLKRNMLNDGYVKILVFYDDGDNSFAARNCSSRVLVAALPAPIVRPVEKWKLVISSWRRPPPNCHPYGAKTSSTYALSFLSHRPRPSWADDVLFLCTEGKVCEASGSNIFFVKGKKLVTPTTATALAGITRQLVIDQLAKKCGFDVEIRDVDADEIALFDGAFLCGTAVEIKEVGQIGDVLFAESNISTKLSEALAAAVRSESERAAFIADA